MEGVFGGYNEEHIPDDILNEMGLDKGDAQVDFNNPEIVEMTEDKKFKEHIEHARSNYISGLDIDVQKVKDETRRQLDSIVKNISGLKLKINDVFSLLCAKRYENAMQLENQIVAMLTELTIDSNIVNRNYKKLLN